MIAKTKGKAMPEMTAEGPISPNPGNTPEAGLPELKKLKPLTMPLKGLHVIEASAGTGKTWTLAALYVRLVLGHAPGGSVPSEGLYPPQILVMTFTDAATAELRGRIRARLAQAARFFRGDSQGILEADEFLRALRLEFAEGQWPACAYRLDMAAQWMDDAAIFTIHGWSSRMLKQHAFDSASLFEQSRVENSDRLRLTAVQDYWRKWFYPVPLSQLDALKPLGRTPEELLKKLATLWSVEDRGPVQGSFDGESPDALLARWSVWQDKLGELEALARPAWTPEVIAMVQDAATGKSIKGYRLDWLAGWLSQMGEWAQGESIKVETLERFSATRLLEKGWSQASEHIVFAHLDALCAHLREEPDVGSALLSHAAREIGAAYKSAKTKLAQFDFSDLLQCLYYALQAPDGRLAAAIRVQFPVALVDEFQDTDPWQYGSLSKIYGEADPLDTGLIMIGDPKQAIYSFRGADLDTYLTARSQAQAIHALSGNFRSTKEVVDAVNHVFCRVDKPFDAIPFERVEACNEDVKPLQVNGVRQTAMTVWHQVREAPARKDAFIGEMAALFASQMVGLLNQGAAEPGQMAVLVRSGHEAGAIRKALSARGVRSVYLSERDSVFATVEATDVWRILRAVASPRSTELVRAALMTRLWGLPWIELESLFQDESAWDDLVDQFHGWQRIWQRQGFLPMLHHLLHDQAIPTRLLAPGRQEDGTTAIHDGERRLTNLLHLGDLLQTASLGLQGEGALIRHLEAQLQNPQASGDAAQLRLESDANLVQVITMHKCKGLQYPLVFLPFVSNFRAETKDSGKDDAFRLAEDVRLLYVALTRAEQALWVGIAQVKGDLDGRNPQVKSAISRLLGRKTPGDLEECLKGWSECSNISVTAAPAPDQQRFIPRTSEKIWKPVLEPQRLLISRWWTASFSALTRRLDQTAANATVLESERDDRIGDAQVDNAVVVDASPEEPATSLEAGVPQTQILVLNSFPAGSAYGTLLHDLLEWQARMGWPVSQEKPADAVATEWEALVARKTRRLKLDEAQTSLLDRWIEDIAQASMPLQGGTESTPLVLGALDRSNAWPEMDFTLPVRSLGASRLDRMIQQYVLPGQGRDPLAHRLLEGMLTGFMDLVIEHDGRYFVLDYKSNRLNDYGPMAVQQAILAHRYDVQYTLYLLALHRLLKSRLPGYDYDQHMGGAIYLFLRGIDQPGAGVYQDRPPRALIEALDHAFSEVAEERRAA